jgi:predicted RNase H-like HicB family nuclease
VSKRLGCSSAGETQEEALRNIQEAIALYLEPAPVNLLPGSIIQEVVVGSAVFDG